MTQPPPIFLERKSYRRRRMMDAIRLLPVLGLGLWMVPLMWSLPGPEGTEAAPSMSQALTYIFGIWALVVLVAVGLWGRTGAEDIKASASEPD